MPRKKKVIDTGFRESANALSLKPRGSHETDPFQPRDTASPVDAGHVTDPPPKSLLDQALTFYGLRSSDVFAVRSVAPGVVRIIMRDARKFTYPNPEEK